ncbi:hypothetical protein UFOVP242_235 [uncultured Caudovirales phage]|uniref:Uncharacterized protein n=1 Tax=uncultured Caudovirales phage TaxID=2100421 RepID=A0A6J7WVL5_9CAUD|nr:hypothetical protein UFOVP242_235 [uncultured Caudovirales phage]
MNTQLIGLEKNDEVGYRIYSSPYVITNQQEFITDSEIAYKKYRSDNENSLKKLKYQHDSYEGAGSTWNYDSYNLFSYTGGSPYFHTLFMQFQAVCREWVGDDRPLWLQCWLNYHYPDDVLKWHHHYDSIAHGYVSIDPKNTSTRFEQFTVENEIGKIYIGHCGLFHEVVVNKVFDTPRITIAFQLDDDTSLSSYRHRYTNTSFIPI